MFAVAIGIGIVAGLRTPRPPQTPKPTPRPAPAKHTEARASRPEPKAATPPREVPRSKPLTPAAKPTPPAQDRAKAPKERLAELAAANRPAKTGEPAAPEPVPEPYRVPLPGSFAGIDPAETLKAVQPLPLSDIPDGADALIVNNERVRIQNIQELRNLGPAGFVKPVLYLPKGTTLIAFGQDKANQAFERREHYAEAHETLRGQLMTNARLDMGKLVACVRDSAGAFDTPYVPHFMGRYYREVGQYKAACRKLKQALRINPCFAPAHMDLARLYHRHLGDAQGARRELLLAHHFNINDVFAIQAELWELAEAIGLDSFDADVRLAAADYAPAASQPRPGDADVAALRRAVQKYISSPLVQAKVESNTGLYFAADGRPILAAGHYRDALRSLNAVPDGPERRQVTKGIYQGLRAAYEKMGWAETREYDAILAAM